MGKKSWFTVVKKAVSPSFSKIKKEKRSHKSKSNPKNSWHEKQKPEAALANPPINETEFKLPENEQIKHVDSVTIVEEVNCTRSNPCFEGKTREEISAIKIQTAYRGYTARRALRALRVKMRLRLWIEGKAVKRQTTSTLMRIQTACRVQSQVRARRILMAEVNETLQRQLIQQRQKVLVKDFDLSPKSKEQIEAQLRNKKEAAERREKALAYAFSRQQRWRNSQKRAHQAVLDLNHLEWGWNWSSRWDAIRPWETERTNKQIRDMGLNSPSKARSPSQRFKLEKTKGSVKPTNSGSRILKPGPSPLASRKKCGIRTGSMVGLAMKRPLVMGSRSIAVM